MTIYLYLKTHNTTGLKYLGKTCENPFTYKGSGLYWKRHLVKHGNDVTTEILKECQTNQEIKQWGEYYSTLWNIVESTEFANLKIESGNGGAVGPEGAKKISEKIKSIRNDPTYRNTVMVESIRKMLETRSSTEWMETIGKEARRKHSETRNDPEWKATIGAAAIIKLSEKAKHRKNDPEWRATKGLEARQHEIETKSDPIWKATTGANMKREMSNKRNSNEYKEKHYRTCTHCEKTTDPGNYNLYHGDKCKTINPSLSREQKRVTCPHCHKTGGISSMKRYHFDNCKFNK